MQPPNGLTRDQLDTVRILYELILAGTPLVTFSELATELDTELDATRTLVEELQLLGWVRVPFDAWEPIQVLREPDMSRGGWEAWWQ